MMKHALNILLLMLILPALLQADYSDVAKVEALPDVIQSAPGEDFQVGIFVELKDGWHVYWKHPGKTGLPTRISAGTVRGLISGEIQWPIPRMLEQGGGMQANGYEGNFAFVFPVHVERDIELKDYTIPISLSWLLCSRSVCVPDQKNLSLNIQIGDSVKENEGAARSFADATARLVTPYVAGNQRVKSFTMEAAEQGRRYLIDWITPPEQPELFFAARTKQLSTFSHTLNGTVSIFSPGRSETGISRGELVVVGGSGGMRWGVSFSIGEELSEGK